MGLFRYFSGKVCKHGHASERYVKTGQCLECIKTRISRERAAMVALYGEEETTRMLRKQWAESSKLHRKLAGEKHTRYIREYHREYRKTATGVDATSRARRRYADKMKND